MMRILFVIALLCASLNTSFAQSSLSLLESKKLTISVSEQSHEVRLTIRSPEMIAAPTLFDVPNPPRVVIDLPEKNTSYKISKKLTEQKLVRSIRIGSHPDHLRIVIDQGGQGKIPSSSTISMEKQISVNEIVLIFKEQSKVSFRETPSPSKTPVTPVESPQITLPSPTATKPMPSPTATITVAPTSTPSPTPSSTPTPQPTPAVTPESTPKATPEAAIVPQETATPPATPVPSQRTLLEYLFQFEQAADGNKVPVLEIKLSERGEYRFSKKVDREFSLTLPKATLKGEHQKLAYFAPRDFSGIDGVQATQDDEGVTITLLAERGYRLTASPSGNSIIVRSQSWP